MISAGNNKLSHDGSTGIMDALLDLKFTNYSTKMFKNQQVETMRFLCRKFQCNNSIFNDCAIKRIEAI